MHILNIESSAQAYRMKKDFDEKHTYKTIKTSRQCGTLHQPTCTNLTFERPLT